VDRDPESGDAVRIPQAKALIDWCASIEDIEVRRNDGVELRNIVCQSCGEYHAHRIYDLRFVGNDEFLPGSPSNGIRPI
jgi:hypothetical protein